ncbi:MAG: energy-coupling factor ABC transporter permease [Chloroflexota bacterium]
MNISLLAINLAPQALHAPDGFMSLPVAIAGYVISGAVIAYATIKANKELGERQVPLMGVMAAFIFAAQMINFPVAGGTSGHFVGGALAAILLGPWAAALVMTAVVGIQALLFQDGGLVVLGVNIFNMAVASCLVGYGTYALMRTVIRNANTARLVGGFIAAWLSVVVAALLCAVELAVSGTSPLGVALPAMAGVHLLIGLVEALITVAALSFIAATRKDLFDLRTAGRGG